MVDQPLVFQPIQNLVAIQLNDMLNKNYFSNSTFHKAVRNIVTQSTAVDKSKSNFTPYLQDTSKGQKLEPFSASQ